MNDCTDRQDSKDEKHDDKASLEVLRERLVSAHESIRDALAALAAVTRRVANGDATEDLQRAIERVCTVARDYLDLEDATLVPLLESVGGWEKRRVEEYLEDHRQQRDVIFALADETRSGCKPGPAIADDATWVASSIERELRAEKALLGRLELGLASTMNPFLARS